MLIWGIFVLFLRQVSYNPDWLGTHCVSQATLEFLILLSVLFKCCYYRHTPPHPVFAEDRIGSSTHCKTLYHITLPAELHPQPLIT